MKGFDHVHADERYGDGCAPPDRAERMRMSRQPQGQALILELQRLRQAFELDNQQDQRPPLRRPANDEGRPGARRPRQARPKRSKKKGKMGRVLDWLGPFGSQSEVLDPEPPPPRSGRSTREPQFMAPPPADGMRAPAGNASAQIPANERQARGPIIAPDDPSLMNMPRSRPEVLSIDDTAAAAAHRGSAIGAAEPGGPGAARSFRDGRRPQRPDRRRRIPCQSRWIGGCGGRARRKHRAAGGARLRGRIAHRLAGAARRRRGGGRLDDAGAVVGRRRGAGQSGGAVQRQDHPASDRRRGRADPGP